MKGKWGSKWTHVCACLIGLHLFTLPVLALLSFILPRSITQLPGKYVSNRLFFHPPNISMKALKTNPQVIITFWVLERSTEVAYLRTTIELSHNFVQLFSHSCSKYLLLDQCCRIYFHISGVNCFANFNSCWNLCLMVAAVVLMKNQTVKYWPFEVSATDLNSHSVTRNIRERSFILSVTSAVNNSDCWFCLVLTQNLQGRHEGQFLFCNLNCITLPVVYILEQLGRANCIPEYIFKLVVNKCSAATTGLCVWCTH